jgi:hypothetical protein
MSKDQYLEMMEQMGQEPLDEEMPPDGGDLEWLAQLALTIYSRLPDKVDSMGGLWLGKDFSGIGDILDIYELNNDEKKDVLEYMHIAITESHKFYEEKRKFTSRGIETQGR